MLQPAGEPRVPPPSRVRDLEERLLLLEQDIARARQQSAEVATTFRDLKQDAALLRAELRALGGGSRSTDTAPPSEQKAQQADAAAAAMSDDDESTS